MGNLEMTRELAAIGALVVEVFARQLALFGLLRSQPGFDEQTIRKAVQKAHEELSRIPGVATLRSQISGQALEGIETSLRGLLFPK